MRRIWMGVAGTGLVAALAVVMVGTNAAALSDPVTRRKCQRRI